MSIPNRHTVVLSGGDLVEITTRAGAAFDAYFGELHWEFEAIDADAQIVSVKDGAGVSRGEQISGWEVTFIATVPALGVEVS